MPNRFSRTAFTILPIIVSFVIVGFSSVGISSSQGLSLPIFSDFDEDIVDFQPLTGGPDRPSEVRFPTRGHVLVVAESLGLQTQPAEIYLPDDSEFASIGYEFEPVTSGVLRVEFVASFESLVSGYFLQTAQGPNRLVVTRLGINSGGNIHGYFQPTFGTIEAGVPFRMRIDIDMDSKTWSAILDDELNGFGDDELIEGAEFVNDAEKITSVGYVGADLNPFSGQGESRIAYDEISIEVIDSQ